MFELEEAHTEYTTPTGFRATSPASGGLIEPVFGAATSADVIRACQQAEAASAVFRNSPCEVRAALLEAIADQIIALGDPLLERAAIETGLPLARLTGERGRTVGQLRLFAAELRDGSWLDLRIDPALPDRLPVPRPDLRLRKIAVGPVAVFGASNFPLAFSVAGGDTAAALAAGCPVVAKAHPAHPGTSQMVGAAITAAVAAADLPDGVFALLTGPGTAAGAALVAHSAIKAVGFTGSRGGGLALMEIAANRPVPIPVFAEMSSINPVFLLPGALAERAAQLGAEFVGSLTLGAGQFCTNPGIVCAVAGPALDAFIASAITALNQAAAAVMLSPGIHEAYVRGAAQLAGHGAVTPLAEGIASDQPNRGQPRLFSVGAADFMADPALQEEVFGAASVIVRCADFDELYAVAQSLEGQLTATLHLAACDYAQARRLIELLETKAGRILANGWPTGVEVSHAMVHGGPFPATSDGRSTSVGTLAIDRFTRPVCYQDIPKALLPAVLQDNAVGQPRRVDGVRLA